LVKDAEDTVNKNDHNPDEHSLIIAMRSGDKTAFSLIVKKYQSSVIRICRGYVGSVEDAEDIAQDVFVELYRSAAGFRGDASISTWIYRIAINRSINYLRDNRRKFRVYRSSDSAGEKALVNSQTDLPVDSEVINSDHREALHLAIESLPDNQKKVFVLNKYDDLSYRDIADILKISHSAVESLLFRAKQNLQNSLAEYYRKNIL